MRRRHVRLPHSAFCFWATGYWILASGFRILPSPFPILHSSFCIQHSHFMPHRHQLDIPSVPGLWPLTWPMGLTMLRLLLLPVFLWLILANAGTGPGPRRLRWVAVGVFAVMALTDKLDGYLARRLNQTSRLGAVLDPIADKLLVACSVMLLSFDWVVPEPYRIPMPVVVVVYGGYIVITFGILLLLALVGRVSVAPRPLGKLGTVLSLLLVILTLVASSVPSLSGTPMRVVLVALWWAVPVVALATCIDYIIQGIRQFGAARSEAKVSAPG